MFTCLVLDKFVPSFLFHSFHCCCCFFFHACRIDEANNNQRVFRILNEVLLALINAGNAGPNLARQQSPVFDLRQCRSERDLMALNEFLLDDNNREGQFVSRQFIMSLLFVDKFVANRWIIASLFIYLFLETRYWVVKISRKAFQMQWVQWWITWLKLLSHGLVRDLIPWPSKKRKLDSLLEVVSHIIVSMYTCIYYSKTFSTCSFFSLSLHCLTTALLHCLFIFDFLKSINSCTFIKITIFFSFGRGNHELIWSRNPRKRWDS